jgi:AraC-like DNA-binding protein
MQRTPRKLHQSPKRLLRILSAGAYQAAKGVHFPPHRHSHWELVYYRSGAVGCLMSGKSCRGYPGLVWLTPPGITHAERAVSAYANYYLALDLKNVNPWPAFLDDDADGSLGRICQQIVIECNRASEERSRMLELLAEQLVCLLNRISAETVLSHPTQTVTKAERLIEEGCGQSLTIYEVAQAVHTAPSTLRGYFKSVRGCSPRDYLRQVRLGKAIGFLRTSTLKLEVVAELCGYDSASHLTRCVKKSTGQTPGQIRFTGKKGRAGFRI